MNRDQLRRMARTGRRLCSRSHQMTLSLVWLKDSGNLSLSSKSLCHYRTLMSCGSLPSHHGLNWECSSSLPVISKRLWVYERLGLTNLVKYLVLSCLWNESGTLYCTLFWDPLSSRREAIRLRQGRECQDRYLLCQKTTLGFCPDYSSPVVSCGSE